MLIKIYENNKKIKYYHFGDIDVGGFKILVHLISKTKIKFIPLNMDEDTLIKNIKYAKDLTQNDIKEINRLLDKEEFREYYNILTFILKKGEKLEQEIVSI
ncbi:MAG: Wadjet anti-phage system protein JetD domain-containing protein [Clostridium sp.]